MQLRLAEPYWSEKKCWDIFIKSFITAVNILTCWHRFIFILLCLCSSCYSIIPLSTSESKLYLFYLSLHSMLLFAYLFLFGLWGLLRLVSNLVSHRDRNKPGAIWGIFTAYLNYKNEHAFFFTFTTSQTFVKLLLLWCSLSLSPLIIHVIYCWKTVSAWCDSYKLPSKLSVSTLEPGACYCTVTATVTNLIVTCPGVWFLSLPVLGGYWYSSIIHIRQAYQYS